MVLLGFYHTSSLFTSPMTSIHTGARDNRHCERECACGRVSERIGALKIVSGFKTRPPQWQASALAPWAALFKISSLILNRCQNLCPRVELNDFVIGTFLL